MLERAVILCRGDFIGAELLPAELQQDGRSKASASEPGVNANLYEDATSLAEMEKKHIAFTLERCGGNKSKTARELGISRSTLREKMKLYEIQ